MPTENRSGNTEQMFSAPRSLLEEACNGLRITQDRTRKELRALLAQPADQHQGEPVAFYREFVDGREYCEKPFTNDWTPLYTHADAGEVERLRAELESVKSSRDAFAQNAIDLRAQLAERDALLKRQPSFINTLETFEADDGTFVRLSDVLGALSASAEPEVKS